MRNASGHQCKKKMSGREKKSERKNARVTNTKLGYNIFRLIKTKITVCVLKY